MAGRRAVTTEIALRLERLGAASAGILLRLQAEYDLALGRIRLSEELASIEPARHATPGSGVS
jgi:plasmid maintenance system antidote protein VapI